MNYNESYIEGKLVALHTAFVGKVTGISESYATVKPLTYAKSASGELIERAAVSAYVPEGVKTATEEITYLNGDGVWDSIEVVIPAELAVGDVVFCGVSERDISPEQIAGQIVTPTRRHDANDAVVLAVL